MQLLHTVDGCEIHLLLALPFRNPMMRFTGKYQQKMVSTMFQISAKWILSIHSRVLAFPCIYISSDAQWISRKTVGICFSLVELKGKPFPKKNRKKAPLINRDSLFIGGCFSLGLVGDQTTFGGDHPPIHERGLIKVNSTNFQRSRTAKLSDDARRTEFTDLTWGITRLSVTWAGR